MKAAAKHRACVTVKAQDSEIALDVVARVFIDVMYLDGLARDATHTASTVCLKKNTRSDIDRNVCSFF
jgi:hypothetical protein